MANHDAVPPEAIPFSVAASLTLPTFWTESPDLWITQVEAKFSISRITSPIAKYLHLVAALHPQVALQVADVLNTPVTPGSYDTLKDAILSRLMPSPEEQLQRFLEPEEMGDRTPSQYLRYLMHLLGTKAATTDPEIIKQVFLKRLPVSVRFSLAVCSDSPLDTLVKIADRMMAVSFLEVNPSVRRPVLPTTPDRDTELQRLREEVTQLRWQLAEHSSRNSQQSPAEGRNICPPGDNVHRHSSALRPGITINETCFYHQRFGSAARKCIQPCSSHQENSQARR